MQKQHAGRVYVHYRIAFGKTFLSFTSNKVTYCAAFTDKEQNFATYIYIQI